MPLKVICLAPVTSAVNHHLSPSDVNNVLLSLLVEEASESHNQHAHRLKNVHDDNNILEVYLGATDRDNLFHRISLMQYMNKTQERRAGCSNIPLKHDLSLKCASEKEIILDISLLRNSREMSTHLLNLISSFTLTSKKKKKLTLNSKK